MEKGGHFRSHEALASWSALEDVVRNTTTRLVLTNHIASAIVDGQERLVELRYDEVVRGYILVAGFRLLDEDIPGPDILGEAASKSGGCAQAVFSLRELRGPPSTLRCDIRLPVEIVPAAIAAASQPKMSVNGTPGYPGETDCRS